MTKIGFKLEAEGSAQAAGNVQKLVDEVTKLDNEITDLNKSMRELKKEGKMEEFTVAKRRVDDLKYSKQQLNKQIRDNRKELDLQKKSLDDLIGGFRIGGVSVNEFKTVLGKTTTGLQVSGKAVLTNITALKAFRIALAATGIGLIVIALGALVTYLTKTQKGMDFVAKVSAAVSAVFSKLIERVAKFGEGIFKILTLDFGGGIDAIGASVKGLGSDLVQTAKDGYTLEKQMQDLAQEEIGLNVILAERRNKVKALSKVLEDQAASEKDRVKAGEEAVAITKQITDLENRFADKRIAALQKLQSLGITNREDEAELARLQADRSRANTANVEMETTIQSKYNAAMGVNKKVTQELVEGPIESLRKKLTEVEKLIAGGSLEGNALRDKIVEMLDLKGEVDAMEEKIRAITEEVSRGAAPTQFEQLEGGEVQADQVGSLDPRVEQTLLTEEEIRKIRKDNNDKMLEDYEARQKAELELDKQHHEQKLDLLDGFSQDVGAVVGGILSDGFETFKDFEDALLVTLVDGIEKAINVLLAQAFARQFADKPAPLALAAFGVITGLVKGFFNGVKSGITKRAKGGIMDGVLSGPSHAQGGIPVGHDEMEGGEAIINKHSTAKFRPLLSAINSFNGYGKKFQTGGIRGNIPAFVGVSAAQGVSLSPLSSTASIADESIAAMAGALGSAVRQGIGAGLQDAHRMNERENVYQRTSRV